MIVLSLKCIFIQLSSDSLTLFPFREGKVQLLRKNHEETLFPETQTFFSEPSVIAIIRGMLENTFGEKSLISRRDNHLE